MNGKDSAYEFLRTLHENLDASFAGHQEMHTAVGELIKLGQSRAEFRYLCSPEHAFTRGIALPKIHEELTGTFNLSLDQAREALLTEGWINHMGISSNTPARTVRHPFDKALISDASLVYQKWAKESKRLPLTQSCPDFALRPPCPHKIVFEAKYFTRGSQQLAERELVTDLYQTFFYRALPPTYAVPERPWDYDYACLFAYDASPYGAFKAAWEALDTDVREGFWKGANVYVMVLRGR